MISPSLPDGFRMVSLYNEMVYIQNFAYKCVHRRNTDQPSTTNHVCTKYVPNNIYNGVHTQNIHQQFMSNGCICKLLIKVRSNGTDPNDGSKFTSNCVHVLIQVIDKNKWNSCVTE